MPDTTQAQPRLFTPGPVDSPERVRQVLMLPVRHHRTRGFAEILQRVRKQLARVWQAEGWDSLVYTCTGTGSLEAAVVNFMKRDAKAVFVGGGKFGERWGKILRAYQCEAIEYEHAWGTAADPDRLASILRSNTGVRAVYLTSTDTSTGVRNDVPALAAAVRANSDALIVVDCVCDFGGATDIRPNEWDIDVAVSCSQKCLMLPPGLGMATVSSRAWTFHETADLPRFYFDWSAELKKQNTQSVTAWTSPTSMIRALQESLAMIEEEGLPQVFARYRRHSAAVRAGIKAMGLTVFAESPSDGVTSVRAPEGVQVASFLDWVEDNRNIRMANGQDQIKNKIFRIGNMGNMRDQDMLDVISGIEAGLEFAGVKTPLGQAVAATSEALGTQR